MSTIRYDFTIPLLTSSPLHSGGVEESVDRSWKITRERPAPQNAGASGVEKEDRDVTPRRFARNGNDTPILSGRSVKGALRAACDSAIDAMVRSSDMSQDQVKQLRDLWGKLESESSQGHASTITVHAVELPEIPDKPEYKRHGNAMDRYWGAAGDSALFAHEILPTGSQLSLHLSARVHSEDPKDLESRAEQVRALFEVLLGAVKARLLVLGGRKGAGWGRVELAPGDGWELRESRFDTPQGVLDFLDASPRQVAVAPRPITVPDTVEICIKWKSPSGILVAEAMTPEARAQVKERRAKRQAFGAPEDDDVEPIKTVGMKDHRSTEGDAPYVLPGSSLRGALRARASRIARTILFANKDTQPLPWKDVPVHDQLAKDPDLVRFLFGSTDHRGALTVLDTLSTGSETLTVTHNAGDRWTGGVIDGGLYCESYPIGEWDDVRLEFGTGYLTYSERETELNWRRAGLCLLGLVLSEMATGTLPLGSRGTRGLGEVTVTRIDVKGPEDLVPGGSWTIEAGDGDGRSIALQLLEHLRDVNNALSEDGGGGNWTSFLNRRATGGDEA